MINGMSDNSIARELKVDEKTIRLRRSFLSRQGQLFIKKAEEKIKLDEPISYDGFETFSYDQFSPCYINTSVGQKSLYTYTTNYSPLNRKGRMTSWQKQKNIELQQKFGLYPSSSVKDQTSYTLKRLCKILGEKRLTLHTDEHKSYLAAIRSGRFFDRIDHFLTNSKERRDPKNPLFAVNHLHGNYRHFLASQRRETIAFQKNEAALVDKINCMKLHKNFMREKFIKRQKSKRDNICSPAMLIGLENKILTFDEVFSERKFLSHYEMDQDELRTFRREYFYSRQSIKGYKGL